MSHQESLPTTVNKTKVDDIVNGAHSVRWDCETEQWSYHSAMKPDNLITGMHIRM